GPCRRDHGAVPHVDHQAARNVERVEMATLLGAVVAGPRRHTRRLATVVAGAARGRAPDLADLPSLLARGGLVRAAPELVGGVGLRARNPTAIGVRATELADRMAPRGILADVLPVLTAGRSTRTRAASLITLDASTRAQRARHAARACARATRI